MSEAKQEHSVRRSPPGRKFTAEFKQRAVRLVTDQKYTFKAAAEALNVGEQSLRQWHAKLAPAPTPCGEHASLDELRAENRRLQRELRRAEMERDILPMDRSTPLAHVSRSFSRFLDFTVRAVRRSW